MLDNDVEGGEMAEPGIDDGAPLELDEEAWRERLSPEQFRVLRLKETDPPFAGRFVHPGRQGTYRCAGCKAELFDASEQFDSGSGWPSFTAPISPDAVELQDDTSYGMHRVEVVCSRCGGHLGHVFRDGPKPTGERWCINSTSLELDPGQHG
jgi:peptide-methionine (R)-S-oxide reductase